MRMSTAKFTPRLLTLSLMALLVAAIGLSACTTVGGVAELVDDDPNALPTARPGIEIGAEVQSAAGSSYEETWERYLRDSIAYQNDRQAVRLALIQAYQNPDHTAQNTGGLLQVVELVEDRSSFDLTNNSTFAQSYVDFDVRMIMVDGDTSTLTCNYTVQIEFNPEDERWYVINPTGLDVYSVCG